MDSNKLALLKQVGYAVSRCCYFCKHAGPFKLNTIWSTCLKHKYRHLKHTGDLRQMSIVKFGVCSSFEPNDAAKVELGTFGQLMAH